MFVHQFIPNNIFIIMISLLHIFTMFGLLLLPLLKRPSKQAAKPVIYKIDSDTADAHYAINSHGYLEEVQGNKVHGNFID